MQIFTIVHSELNLFFLYTMTYIIAYQCSCSPAAACAGQLVCIHYMEVFKSQLMLSFVLCRSAAGRASILYFILNDLFKINSMYQFSLKAYSVVFKDALAKADPADDLDGRIINLQDSITYQVIILPVVI